MPRGFGGVREASAEVEARRAGGGPGLNYFSLKAGDEAIVRFLEQDDDVAWAHVHEVPVEGRSWGRPVICLDQDRDGTPCPGCERELPRKFKGWVNLIWFDGPVYKTDKEGKIVKVDGDKIVDHRKDQAAVWTSGIRLFEELDEINANFKGLMSRRFRVKRKGEGLNTTYSITPEDVDSGPQPMTKEEKKLSEDKADLGAVIKPGTYEEFLKELGEGGSAGHGNGDTPSTQRVNPFMRNS